MPSMEMRDLIVPEAVGAHLRGTSKKQVLQEIANRAAEVYRLDARVVLEALLDRERLGSTAMGRGVAAPHARIPGIDRVFGVFSRLDRSVDFDAQDDVPVDLVFALIAPEDAGSEHLLALARVSRVLRDPAVCAKLRSSADASALYAVLTEPPVSRAA
jgi:PTS system nitrogen regulatory IIA component